MERLTRSSTVAAAAAQRARIVLLAAQGVANYEIAEKGCVSSDGEFVAWPVRAVGSGGA